MTSSSLVQRHDLIWRELRDCVNERNHPWRIPVIATTDDTGAADQRIMVLREVDVKKRLLVFTTDRRSTKVAQIAGRAATHLLFWNPATTQQLRIKASAAPRTNAADIDAMWERVPASTRTTFESTTAPGTLLDTPTAAVVKRSGDGRQNFSVVDFSVTEIEGLELCEPGHQRYRFQYSKTTIDMDWMTP